MEPTRGGEEGKVAVDKQIPEPTITMGQDGCTRECIPYLVGEYEPGNGTRYTAVAMLWTDHALLTMGRMGCVSNGWLVASGLSGRAYLFQGRGLLTDDYIMEHLGGNPGDYPYFGDLIRRLTMREG